MEYQCEVKKIYEKDELLKAGLKETVFEHEGILYYTCNIRIAG